MYTNSKHKTPSIESEIGKRIKALRTKKSITLEQLASKTGFTKGYLSRVEKSEKSPPVSTLVIISRALEITLSTLLGEKTYNNRVCMVKKSERLLIARDGTAFGYSYEDVAHKFSGKTMQPFVLTIGNKAKETVKFLHDSEEMFYVLKGTIRFTHGDEEFIAEEGDCVYFDANIPHFAESFGGDKAVCLMVLYNR
jgi:transcriptional regulator with XRE-family HTH domain